MVDVPAAVGKPAEDDVPAGPMRGVALLPALDAVCVVQQPRFDLLAVVCHVFSVDRFP